ncbi:hypothetical protein OED01_08425 [Microbacterium sp. M28]|uniref:hypothetical protein n=1 Tax=Microbacterium sp. M28 TaxID=2962064 RepID=UPI0021F4DF1C|nr:hypothetical protein [Microbacterium sp. M28]UYO95644.1 hypothetical protein OED01_08425 [Microbacterium sp. M28]
MRRLIPWSTPTRAARSRMSPMTESTADAPVRVTSGRRLVRNPVLWGALLLGGAIAVTLAGDDLSFLPFLLMLVGGWCFGFAFVNATLRTVPARSGVILHTAVATALGAAIVIVGEAGGDMLDSVPEPGRAVAFVLTFAAIPAAGWIWLGLISRLGDVFARQDAKKRPTPTTPEWEREENGDGSAVCFAAIPVRMRVLTGTTIGIVVVVGLVVVSLLIVLDDVVMRLGPQWMIIVIGAGVALPAYLALRAVLQRRTVECVVAFGDDEIRLTTRDSRHTVSFRDLELLLWRSRSDYARIEVRGAGVDLSLITGLAKPPAGRTAELPALPRRVFRRLELAGMTEKRSRRDDVISFHRP